MVLVVILFLKEVYGYLFYESYPATITSYSEYNSTNKDGVVTQKHSAIYLLEVDEKNISIEEGNYVYGELKPIGSKVKVFYRDEDIIEYNLRELLFSFLGKLVFSIFILFYIRKQEFPDKLVLPNGFNEDEIIEEDE